MTLLDNLGRLDSVPREKLAHELLMLRGNSFRQLAARNVLFVLDRQIFGDQDVDAIRLAFDMIVDPFQFCLQLGGRECCRAEYSHSAGPTHRGDYVAAVAESKQRKI